MARYAIITSIHYPGGHKPAVIIEPGNGKNLSVHHMANQDAAEEYETHSDLESAISGSSYSRIEVGDYSGEKKRRVDEIIKTGRLPKKEEQEIIDTYEQWYPKDVPSTKS